MSQRPGADQAGVQHPEPGPPEQDAGGRRHHRAGEPHRVGGDPAAALSQASRDHREITVMIV